MSPADTSEPGPGARPRDLAALLLALGDDPPRQRARDQQADRAGAGIRRLLLERLVALDPDPAGLDAALDAIVLELGEPTGPTRAVAGMVLRDWNDSRSAPSYWAWLREEAAGAADRPRRRRREEGR